MPHVTELSKTVLYHFRNHTAPTDEMIKKAIITFATLIDGCEFNEADINRAVQIVKSTIETSMGVGVSLIGEDATHDRLWLSKRDINWDYHEAYSDFLLKEGWPGPVVTSLGNTTETILTHLQDPNDTNPWSRRGLVIGNVQSGKTANYTGLIARAADAGYKFIIVIAGIHNNLRKQTQARIDESFIGRNSVGSSDPIGVALDRQHYAHPITLTTVDADFTKQTADQSRWELGNFSQPIIFVIKKNVTVLKGLFSWLKDMNASNNNKITNVPLLMIDDEADHASINTNKEDSDPTKTNAYIRKILNLFSRSSYIGYTATPFANIFIDPEAKDGKHSDDLFPKDFIYCLDAPTNYFGASKIFDQENGKNLHIKIIGDAEEYIPLSHKKDDEITALPPSLYHALNSFILARTIRNLKNQRHQHCSMMVNVSRFVDYQKQVAMLLNHEIHNIEKAVLSNSFLPNSIALQNSYIARLKNIFLEEYANEGFEWDDIKHELPNVFKNFKSFLINNSSPDTLDYNLYSQEGIGLTVVAVGGLSLSRGLTIEGLTISYLYRNTKMYDTLMQMGRWFGYRPNYESLCRIYLSSDSSNWYSHIAEASEELILQVQEMSRQNKTPSDFGLVVRTHPDHLIITAPNKMHHAEEIPMQISYNGKLEEMHKVSLDPEVNKRNFELIKDFWMNNFYSKPLSSPSIKKGYFFKNVHLNTIEEFLQQFEAHPAYQADLSWNIEYLKKIKENGLVSEVGDVLLISPQNGTGGQKPYTLRNQHRRIEEAEYEVKDLWSLNKGRVASRGDEKLGLTEEELSLANEYNLDSPAGRSKSKTLSDWCYRKARNRILLMVHSLIPEINGNPVNLDEPIAAIGISFPPQDPNKKLETITVVANRFWLAQQYNFSSYSEFLNREFDDE